MKIEDAVSPPTVFAVKAESMTYINVLADKISPFYKKGVALRRQLNVVSIEIGRFIIDACRNPEIEARVSVLNSKAQKPNGGTDTRIHSWVADELAKVSGYNAEYLKQCAREYLGALKSHSEQTRVEPPKYLKGGILKISQAELPELKLEPPLVTPPDAPRMDAMFTFEPTPAPQTLTPTQRAREAAEKVQRVLGEADRAAWREFFNAISHVADANGFSILPKGKGGNFK